MDPTSSTGGSARPSATTSHAPAGDGRPRLVLVDRLDDADHDRELPPPPLSPSVA